MQFTGAPNQAIAADELGPSLRSVTALPKPWRSSWLMGNMLESSNLKERSSTDCSLEGSPDGGKHRRGEIGDGYHR
jgi:hypothetical protein